MNRNQVMFSDVEYDRLSYLLEAHQLSLVQGATQIAALQPHTRIAERLTQDAELCADLRERIEAR